MDLVEVEQVLGMPLHRGQPSELAVATDEIAVMVEAMEGALALRLVRWHVEGKFITRMCQRRTSGYLRSIRGAGVSRCRQLPSCERREVRCVPCG